MTYLMVNIGQVRDHTAFQQYAHSVKPLMERHGGRYLAMDREPEIRDGQWLFLRTLVAAPPSVRAAHADSPEYREIMVCDLAESPLEGYQAPERNWGSQ
jgi:uncharacterized protein (DUF1330 family)